MEKDGFYLEVDCGENGVLRFSDLEEIEQFTNDEFASWQWLNTPPVQGRMGNTAWQSIRNNFNPIRQLLPQIRSEPARNEGGLQSSFEQAFGNARIPVSTSRVGSFIHGLKEENPIVAAAAVTTWMNLQGVTFNYFDEVKGAMLMSAFDADITSKTPSSVRTSLKKLNQSFLDVLDSSKLQLRKQDEDFANATNSQRNSIAKLLRGVRAKTFKFKTTQLREIDRALKQIYQTEALYKEHMRLQGPVEYWSEKAESHKGTAKTYRRVLSWFGVIASIVLVGGLYWLAEHAIQIASTDKPPTIYLVLVTLGVVSTTILFWIARILTRLFLSEHHLAIDARERAVMAQTYLALTAEGQASDQERALVLASLFRPTADGIVKDDAAPDLSPAVLLSKFDSK